MTSQGSVLIIMKTRHATINALTACVQIVNPTATINAAAHPTAAAGVATMSAKAAKSASRKPASPAAMTANPAATATPVTPATSANQELVSLNAHPTAPAKNAAMTAAAEVAATAAPAMNVNQGLASRLTTSGASGSVQRALILAILFRLTAPAMFL